MFIPSRFDDILKILPRRRIAKLVDERGSDRWCKRFSSWDHLVTMLAGQFSGLSSLREMEVQFEQQHRRLYHLNCAAPKRSTLADANRNRDHRIFADIAGLLIDRSRRRHRDLKEPLFTLDSSPIRLAGRGHGWADATAQFNGLQGLKLHLMMAPETGRLHYLATTDMNVNDISDAREMPLASDRIYVFDKGYCDYNWWLEIIGAGSHFVTRLKRNAAHRVIEERPVAAEEADFILADQVIELTNKAPRGGKVNRLAGRRLRLVRIPHPGGKDTPFVIVSSLLDTPAAEIAASYKQRWQIELLFK